MPAARAPPVGSYADLRRGWPGSRAPATGRPAWRTSTDRRQRQVRPRPPLSPRGHLLPPARDGLPPAPHRPSLMARQGARPQRLPHLARGAGAQQPRPPSPTRALPSARSYVCRWADRRSPLRPPWNVPAAEFSPSTALAIDPHAIGQSTVATAAGNSHEARGSSTWLSCCSHQDTARCVPPSSAQPACANAMQADRQRWTSDLASTGSPNMYDYIEVVELSVAKRSFSVPRAPDSPVRSGRLGRDGDRLRCGRSNGQSWRVRERDRDSMRGRRSPFDSLICNCVWKDGFARRKRTAGVPGRDLT